VPSTWSQDLYVKAYKFAAQAHRWQWVPGTSIPYIMHLSFVAMEIMGVAGAGETFDADLAVQVALLHDVLEDTRIRYDVLHAEFGHPVADGVVALTNDDNLARAEQLPDCLRRIRMQPREIWMVKLADRITNLQPPPRHWPKAKIREYHQGAQVILRELGEASPFLSQRLSTKIGEYAAYCI
jgi:guanosine-3',5'-bis(diphosphate) 3'-pyrophosphohydrolase